MTTLDSLCPRYYIEANHLAYCVFRPSPLLYVSFFSALLLTQRHYFLPSFHHLTHVYNKATAPNITANNPPTGATKLSAAPVACVLCLGGALPVGDARRVAVVAGASVSSASLAVELSSSSALEVSSSSSAERVAVTDSVSVAVLSLSIKLLVVVSSASSLLVSDAKSSCPNPVLVGSSSPKPVSVGSLKDVAVALPAVFAIADEAGAVLPPPPPRPWPEQASIASATSGGASPGQCAS